jgi:calpain-15
MQPQMISQPQVISQVIAQPQVIMQPQVIAQPGMLPALGNDAYHNMKLDFARNDLNKNNQLDPNELARVLASMGQPVNQQVISSFFMKFDSDRNGQISWSEFCNAFHPEPPTAPAAAIGGPSQDGKFVDAQFPPTPDSILKSPNGQADHIQDVLQHTNGGNCQWIRASELTGHGKLFHHVQPNDITQGTLGDCWLLAGLAGLAEFEGIIFNLFEQKQASPDCKYNVRIYDMNSQQWNSVVVDDLIPCDPRTRKPCMAQPQGHEMWVLLVEKAAAKWFGSYTQINGAFCLVPFMFLTACGPCKNFSQAGGNPNLYDVKQARLADAHNRNSVQMQPLGQCGAEQLWQELMQADDANHVMSAWTTKDPPGGAAGHGASGEAIANDGIVKGHAYSLISIDEYNADGRTHRMVRLRNPWGANPAAEWKGDFSDNWPGWVNFPQLRECLQIGSAECDGMFWMSWDSFRNRYSDCGVAPTKMNVPRSGKSESMGHGATAQGPGAKHGKKFRKPQVGVPTAPMIIAAPQPMVIAAPQPFAYPTTTTYASAPVTYASAPVTYASAPVTYAAAPTYASVPTTYATSQSIILR